MTSQEIQFKAEACLNDFDLLCDIVRQTTETEQTILDVTNKPNADDQLARFRIWAGNLGVFAADHASLDYRLRNNEEAKVTMLSFLDQLQDLLSQARDFLQPEETTPFNAIVKAFTVKRSATPSEHLLPSESSEISSSFDESEIDSLDAPVPGAPLTALEQRISAIERLIDRLYRLSILIRQPSTLKQHRRAERYVMIDDEGNDIDRPFNDYASQIVEHQFPEAPEWLKMRLAKGIYDRRKRFLYRQSHQQKLATRTVHVAQSELNRLADDARSNAMDTIRGQRRVQEMSSPADKSRRKHPAERSATSATALTATVLPSKQALEDTATSVPQSMFTNPFLEENATAVPQPPKPSHGSKEFECPYCCVMLSTSQYAKAHHWRRHVMDDLEPYGCVFEGCKDHAAMFSTFTLWLSHCRQRHSTHWRCHARGHEAHSFDSDDAYEVHMRSDHLGTFTEAQLPFLKKRAQALNTRLFEHCPMCGYQPTDAEINTMSINDKSARSTEQLHTLASDLIAKHIGKHLESLYIRALPWDEENEEETKSQKVGTHIANELSGSNVTNTAEPRALSSSSSLNFDTLPTTPSDSSLDLVEIRDDLDGEVDNIAGAYEEEWAFVQQDEYCGHDRDPVLQTMMRKLYLDNIQPLGPQKGPRPKKGPRLPAFLVPVESDKHFFGREYALTCLEEALCPRRTTSKPGSKPITYPRSFAIYGPGGMGKTQVATQFVTRHRAEFDAVLWVHAENSSKIAQDFKDIAIALELVHEDSVDSTDLAFTKDLLKRWLVNPVKAPKGKDGRDSSKKIEKASWLLVFDGVESPEILNDVWPYDGPGSILITSRSPHSWPYSLELRPFSTAEATEYILQTTAQQPTKESKAAAESIARGLGGLPLALTHVIYMILHQKLPLERVLEQYHEQRHSVPWRASGGHHSLSSYEHNLASVWAFDSLGKGSALLEILSMLDPDRIPENLFKNVPETLELKTLRQDYRTAKNELFARSLISGNKRDQNIIVHRLVQEVARSRMKQSSLRANFVGCVQLISSIWPFEVFTWRHGIERWAACEDLIPHISRLKELWPEIPPSSDTFEDYAFARLLIDGGWYRHERGLSIDARLYNNLAQSICESLKLRLLENPGSQSDQDVTLKKLNYSLSEIFHNRGCIFLEINEPEEALNCMKRFNDMMVKELGEHTSEDMRLAISWNELGNAHMLNRNWVEGESCFLKSIEEMERVDNFRPVLVSLPIANLGLSYWIQSKKDLGKLGLAEETLRKGLQERVAAFGKDDRISFITGRFLHALGNVRGSQGFQEEALDFHRRALLHYKSTLGNRHHRTADMFVKMAEHNITLGQNEMALALVDHALDAYSNSTHFVPEELRASFMRMEALRNLKRDQDARLELQKCFSIYNKLVDDAEKEGRLLDFPRIMDAAKLTGQDACSFVAFWSL